jgi:hypothetical protein
MWNENHFTHELFFGRFLLVQFGVNTEETSLLSKRLNGNKWKNILGDHPHKNVLAEINMSSLG